MKHIDNLFREGIGAYAETPPPAVWEALEDRLDNDRKKRPGLLYRWPWFAVLSLIAVLGSFLVFRMINDGATASPIASTSTAVPAVAQSVARTAEATDKKTATEAGNHPTLLQPDRLQQNTSQRHQPATNRASERKSTVLSDAQNTQNASTLTHAVIEQEQEFAMNTSEQKPVNNAVIGYIVKHKMRNNIMVAESEPVIGTVAVQNAELLSNPVDEEEEETFGDAKAKDVKTMGNVYASAGRHTIAATGSRYATHHQTPTVSTQKVKQTYSQRIATTGTEKAKNNTESIKKSGIERTATTNAIATHATVTSKAVSNSAATDEGVINAAATGKGINSTAVTTANHKSNSTAQAASRKGNTSALSAAVAVTDAHAKTTTNNPTKSNAALQQHNAEKANDGNRDNGASAANFVATKRAAATKGTSKNVESKIVASAKSGRNTVKKQGDAIAVNSNTFAGKVTEGVDKTHAVNKTVRNAAGNKTGNLSVDVLHDGTAKATTTTGKQQNKVATNTKTNQLQRAKGELLNTTVQLHDSGTNVAATATEKTGIHTAAATVKKQSTGLGAKVSTTLTGTANSSVSATAHTTTKNGKPETAIAASKKSTKKAVEVTKAVRRIAPSKANGGTKATISTEPAIANNSHSAGIPAKKTKQTGGRNSNNIAAAETTDNTNITQLAAGKKATTSTLARKVAGTQAGKVSPTTKTTTGNPQKTETVLAATNTQSPALAVLPTTARKPEIAQPVKNTTDSAITVITAKKDTAIAAITSPADSAKQHKLVSIFGFNVSIKGGFESGFNTDASNKFVISPVFEKKLNGKFSVMVQPAIKYANQSFRNMTGGQSFYSINTGGNTVLRDSFLIPIVDQYGQIVDLMVRRNYGYNETHDSVVKTYATGGNYIEAELPVLLKYNITSKFSVYGGVNISYSKLIGVKEMTYRSQPISVSKDSFTFAHQAQGVVDPPSISSVIRYSGNPLSAYSGPTYPSPQGSTFRLGYMFGFGYEFRNRWLFDLLVQQGRAKANNQGGVDLNKPLSSAYFRFTIGYRLFK